MALRLGPRKEAPNERHDSKTHPSKNRPPRVSESWRRDRWRADAGILFARIEEAPSPERRRRCQTERLRARGLRRYGHTVSAQVGNGQGRGDIAVPTAGRGTRVRLEQNPDPIRRRGSGLRPIDGHVRKPEHTDYLGTFTQGRRFGA